MDIFEWCMQADLRKRWTHVAVTWGFDGSDFKAASVMCVLENAHGLSGGHLPGWGAGGADS